MNPIVNEDLKLIVFDIFFLNHKMCGIFKYKGKIEQ